MKWLDDLLGTNQSKGTTPPRSPKKLKKLRVGRNEGTIKDDDGTPIASIKVEHITNSFQEKYRLEVHPEMWEHVEVVCGGNAMEVQTEPLGGDNYRVKLKLAGYTPSVVNHEGDITLREYETTKDFINWIETIDTDSVEALRQIYYDRWTFDSGNQKDRMYFELLEEEKKGRKK